MAKKEFTLVGFYEDNDQCWSGAYEADNADEATQIALMDNAYADGDLVIVGVCRIDKDRKIRFVDNGMVQRRDDFDIKPCCECDAFLVSDKEAPLCEDCAAGAEEEAEEGEDSD